MATRKKKTPMIDGPMKALPPELLALAENEIKVKFMEQPELEAQVKERVADTILSREQRQIIGSDNALKYLKSNLGIELASLLCSIEEKKYAKLLSGGEVPRAMQAKNIAVAYVVVDILLSALPEDAVKEWLTEYSPYLYGIPAVEIQKRPDDVRIAALNRIVRGEEDVVY